MKKSHLLFEINVQIENKIVSLMEAIALLSCGNHFNINIKYIKKINTEHDFVGIGWKYSGLTYALMYSHIKKYFYLECDDDSKVVISNMDKISKLMFEHNIWE